MKIKIFNAWTELLEKLLNDIANQEVSYDQLSAWMDETGGMIFHSAQCTYHNLHLKEYPQPSAGYPPVVKIDLAHDQLAYAFEQIFEALLNSFSAIKDSATTKILDFKKEALGEKFLPYIAARAVITYLNIHSQEQDRLKKFDAVMNDFSFLAHASQAAVQSMTEFRAKIPPTIPREASSPAMYKSPQEGNAPICTAPYKIGGLI